MSSSLDWPEHYKRGLVVTAHADDAEYGCSGTVARLISEGWDFAYVLCTDGSKGSSDRNITEKEFKQNDILYKVFSSIREKANAPTRNRSRDN